MNDRNIDIIYKFENQKLMNVIYVMKVLMNLSNVIDALFFYVVQNVLIISILQNKNKCPICRY